MTLPAIPPQDLESQPKAGQHCLQSLIWPEPGLSSELALYLRMTGPGALDLDQKMIWLEPGAKASFDTYFNSFALGKWAGNGQIGRLGLQIEAEGTFALRLFRVREERSWDCIVSRRIALSGPDMLHIDLQDAGDEGILFFEIQALAPSCLRAARFVSDCPAPAPAIAAIITTFRREAEVTATARRLSEAIGAAIARGDDPAMAALGIIVVDNGNSLSLPPLPHVTLIANRNLGGAGGFARGLAEAEASGFSHGLFMDDDAAIHVESLARGLRFLARARDPATAVAGAMISNSHRWALWEAGALFDGRCRSQFGGSDLRQRDQVFALEFGTSSPPPGLYGGFWFFAFPLAGLRHRPFPYFVRGDDISFSLANPFRIQRLNGVVSFQDDFTEKETVLTHYLDMRSHLAHHLTLPALARGGRHLALSGLKMLARSLIRFHYEAAEAQLMAWRDVLAGPETFRDDPDLRRRPQVQALARAEVFRPNATPLVPRKPRLWGGLMRGLFKLTLNGHFLPLPGLWAGRARLGIGQRGDMAQIWGCRALQIYRPDSHQAYDVARSDRLCLRLVARGLTLAWRCWRDHGALLARYRAAYPQLTSSAYWQGQFAKDPDVTSGAAPPQGPDLAAQNRADLEHVDQIKKNDDRDRNADKPGENTFHDLSPAWICHDQNAATVAIVPQRQATDPTLTPAGPGSAGPPKVQTARAAR